MGGHPPGRSADHALRGLLLWGVRLATRTPGEKQSEKPRNLWFLPCLYLRHSRKRYPKKAGTWVALNLIKHGVNAVPRRLRREAGCLSNE